MFLYQLYCPCAGLPVGRLLRLLLGVRGLCAPRLGRKTTGMRVVLLLLGPGSGSSRSSLHCSPPSGLALLADSVSLSGVALAGSALPQSTSSSWPSFSSAWVAVAVASFAVGCASSPHPRFFPALLLDLGFRLCAIVFFSLGWCGCGTSRSRLWCLSRILVLCFFESSLVAGRCRSPRPCFHLSPDAAGLCEEAFDLMREPDHVAACFLGYVGLASLSASCPVWRLAASLCPYCSYSPCSASVRGRPAWRSYHSPAWLRTSRLIHLSRGPGR